MDTLCLAVDGVYLVETLWTFLDEVFLDEVFLDEVFLDFRVRVGLQFSVFVWLVTLTLSSGSGWNVGNLTLIHIIVLSFLRCLLALPLGLASWLHAS